MMKNRSTKCLKYLQKNKTKVQNLTNNKKYFLYTEKTKNKHFYLGNKEDRNNINISLTFP